MNSSSSDTIERYAFVDAVRSGNSAEVTRLLDSGACSIHSSDQHRRTGVHLAVLNNDHVTCALILGRGAYLNPKDDEGQTPMHYWAVHRDLDMLRLLQSYNASGKAYRDDGVSTEGCAIDMNSLFGDIVRRREWFYATAARQQAEAIEYKRKQREPLSLIAVFEQQQGEDHKQKKSRSRF